MSRFLYPLIFVLFLCLAQTSEAKEEVLVVVPDDCATIEAAYATVKDGGIITIKPGKYELTKTLEIDRKVTFQSSSENPEDVVIDCPDSNAFMITGGSPSFKNLTVTSGGLYDKENAAFYVTGGSPSISKCTITSRKGFGIVVEGKETDPTFEDCVVKACKTLGVVVKQGGLGEFRNCEISENASAIVVYESGNSTFIECKIHDNTVGVGVIDSGLGTFRDCEIYKSQIGFVTHESGNPTVTNCKIHDQKKIGVLIKQKGLGEFSSCEIYGNDDPILVGESGNPTFIECKIHDNFGGVEVLQGGLGTFRDCEIYQNEKGGIVVLESGNPTVTGCKIHDGKSPGVIILSNGMGTFNNNTLTENYLNGKPCDWGIDFKAGEVKGSGNTPEIPEKRMNIK